MPTSLTRSALATILGIAAFGSCGADTGSAPPPVRTIPVAVGSVTVHAELATTLAERERGLMEHAAIPDTGGMLFVFGHDQILSFWMKNTQVNLAIAFLDSAKTILNIAEMTALDEATYHRSAGLARYALEVKEGWFAARGIVAGAKATFTLPPGLTIDP